MFYKSSFTSTNQTSQNYQNGHPKHLLRQERPRLRLVCHWRVPPFEICLANKQIPAHPKQNVRVVRSLLSTAAVERQKPRTPSLDLVAHAVRPSHSPLNSSGTFLTRLDSNILQVHALLELVLAIAHRLRTQPPPDRSARVVPDLLVCFNSYEGRGSWLIVPRCLHMRESFRRWTTPYRDRLHNQGIKNVILRLRGFVHCVRDGVGGE